MVHQFDSRIIDSLSALKNYCEKENFKGWDPYDGLNSKFFRSTPLKHWKISRLAWIQLFKRSPLNLRRMMLVPKGYNAKGIGLFLTAYCNLYKVTNVGYNQVGNKGDIKEQINYLAMLLIKLQSKGYSGACWGYNFDWQNRVFYQPKDTPTVVATSFCADALFNAYEVTGEMQYLKIALSSARFVYYDLNRIRKGKSVLFSYSPLDQSQVYNASLLGVRLLTRSYKYCGMDNYLNLARKVLKSCIDAQQEDGSWFYGAAKTQQWIDSFHTGFNLECIWEYMNLSGDTFPKGAFEIGMKYYIENFFLDNGVPKYYHNKTYPIDIHSPAQLVVTMAKTNTLKSNKELVEKVLCWTVEHMQNKKGYFYYQMKKGMSSKISYMRWAQSWMLYAYSYYSVNMNIENT